MIINLYFRLPIEQKCWPLPGSSFSIAGGNFFRIDIRIAMIKVPSHLISAASLPHACSTRKCVINLCHYVPIFVKLTVQVAVLLRSIIQLKLDCWIQSGSISGRVNRMQGHWLPNCCSLTPKHQWPLRNTLPYQKANI